jgi:GTP-binding protein
MMANLHAKICPITIHESQILISVPNKALAPAPEEGRPEIVMVGRSNVGKSSWINSMLGRKNLARTSNTPGKTRLMNFYEAQCSSEAFPVPRRWLFVDLPGYGYAKVSKKEQADWNKSFQQYLKYRDTIDMVVQLIDARHGFMSTDIDMLDWLLYHDLPVMIVLTKTDKCTNRERAASIDTAKKLMDRAGLAQLPLIPYSAEKHEGRVPCWLYLADQAGLSHLSVPDSGEEA